MPTLTVEEVAKEYVLEVSEADYRRQLAEIGDEDAVMKPGRHIFRRVPPERLAKPEDLAPRNTRVIVKLGLALDLYDYFKAKSVASGGENLAAQVNAELRAVMEREQVVQQAAPYAALLEDERFLAALAAKLKALQPKRPRR